MWIYSRHIYYIVSGVNRPTGRSNGVFFFFCVGLLWFTIILFLLLLLLILVHPTQLKTLLALRSQLLETRLQDDALNACQSQSQAGHRQVLTDLSGRMCVCVCVLSTIRCIITSYSMLLANCAVHYLLDIGPWVEYHTHNNTILFVVVVVDRQSHPCVCLCG